MDINKEIYKDSKIVVDKFRRNLGLGVSYICPFDALENSGLILIRKPFVDVGDNLIGLTTRIDKNNIVMCTNSSLPLSAERFYSLLLFRNWEINNKPVILPKIQYRYIDSTVYRESYLFSLNVFISDETLHQEISKFSYVNTLELSLLLKDKFNVPLEAIAVKLLYNEYISELEYENLTLTLDKEDIDDISKKLGLSTDLPSGAYTIPNRFLYYIKENYKHEHISDKKLESIFNIIGKSKVDFGY